MSLDSVQLVINGRSTKTVVWLKVRTVSHAHQTLKNIHAISSSITKLILFRFRITPEPICLAFEEVL